MLLQNVIILHEKLGYCRVNLEYSSTIDKCTIVDENLKEFCDEDFFVTPGLVNSHLHPNQLFDRRLLDDLHITRLLDKMHALYQKTDQDRYVQAVLVLMEAVKTGSTTIYSVASKPLPVIQAYKDLGIKGAVTCFFNDKWEGHGIAPKQDNFANIEKSFSDFYTQKTDDIDIHIGSASVESASNDLLVLLDNLAKKYNTKVNMHISEGAASVASCFKSRKTTPVRLLEELKVLHSYWNLIHAVSIDEEEVKIIAKNNASVIHCPVSNAKTAAGIAPIKCLLENNVTIALGTDACSNNNTNNIFNEAYFASLIFSAINHDVDTVQLHVLWDWVTTNGYRILGKKPITYICEKQPADILLWSLNSSTFVPRCYKNFLSTLIYNAPDTKPHTVIISGKKIVENYRFLSVSENSIKKAVDICAQKIILS
ncbi:MAG: amidohydrolase family protein [Parachlamydiales bacterium]|nr:amidohydrolase family protein [Parachlamydiales bacterium]